MGAAIKQAELEEDDELDSEAEPTDEPKPRDKPVKADETEIEVGAPVEDSRNEKRRNRFAENRRRAEEAEARAREAETALQEERTRRTVIETNWELEQRRQQDAQKPSKFETELTSLADEHNRLVAQFDAEQRAGTLDKDKADTIRKRAAEIQQRRTQIVVEQTLEQRSSQPSKQPTAREEVIKQHIEMNFPDIVQHPTAKKAFIPMFQLLVAEGRPDNMATLNEALQQTRVKFGLASPAPSDAARRRTSSVSAGAGGGVGAAPKGKMKLSKAQIEMATTLYPKLPKAQAVQKWVNEVGSKDD